MTTYEEWRVTGHPGQGFGLYEFTWSRKRGDEDPEAKARRFIRVIAKRLGGRVSAHAPRTRLSASQGHELRPAVGRDTNGPQNGGDA